jgi:hypothetical protein
MFLMVTRRLRPGFDRWMAIKLIGFRRYLNDSPLQPDLSRFDTAATELGVSEKVAPRKNRRRWRGCSLDNEVEASIQRVRNQRQRWDQPDGHY